MRDIQGEEKGVVALWGVIVVVFELEGECVPLVYRTRSFIFMT